MSIPPEAQHHNAEHLKSQILDINWEDCLHLRLHSLINEAWFYGLLTQNDAEDLLLQLKDETPTSYRKEEV